MVRTLLILLLLPLTALAVDSVKFHEHYPATDETSIPRDTTIWWYVPSYPDLSLSELTVWVTGAMAVDSGVIDSTHWSFSVSHDTLSISRADRNLSGYQEVQVKVQVARRILHTTRNGVPVAPYYTLCGCEEDSFTFRTEADTLPFMAISLDGYWLTGTTATGTADIRVARPYGTTVYCIEPDAETLTIYTPSTTYATERMSRIVSYALTGIARGHNVYQFYALTPESLYTDTARVILNYTQLDNGIPRGTVGR